MPARRTARKRIACYTEARAAGREFDVVIVDLTVPGGHGRITKPYGSCAAVDPPVVKAVVSSGYSNDPLMTNFQQDGFSGVIAMPISDGGTQQGAARPYRRGQSWLKRVST